MSNFIAETESHVAQLWAARLAEQDSNNIARLAVWHSRLPRDPVPVPPRKEIAWLSIPNVQPMKARGFP